MNPLLSILPKVDSSQENQIDFLCRYQHFYKKCLVLIGISSFNSAGDSVYKSNAQKHVT